MSQNVLEGLLDAIAITNDQPLCHLVTTYIACIGGKYKIQSDFLFGDNIAI